MSEVPTRHTNRLASETSPYLLQHAHNPVNWYPWGTEALRKAKEENKLLIVSIGYSACHWCHVMEHESFEDEEAARLMNEHFISVKVDREERPDVDALYMDAVSLMSGHGGWPLNCFTLPDGRPVYAGTYFPKNQWLGLLRHMAFDYKKDPEKFVTYAEKLTEGIQALSDIALPEESTPFTKELLQKVYQSFYPHFDRTNGGKGRAPKFPMPDIYLFLLRYHYAAGDVSAIEQVHLTLDKMGRGGIYDQIGGGFARYSTDSKWLVPHFEKMLYDNAQLISLYAEAWQQSGNSLYKKIVYQTVEFIERELMSPEGGFYCALDAESEGEEGKYYIWTEEEFDAVGQQDAPMLRPYFGIGKEGYWEEGKNILVAAEDTAALAAAHGMNETELADKIAAASRKLLTAREKRIRPGLDNKILLSWNALMLRGLLDAYRIFGDEKFIRLAERNYRFLQDHFADGAQLYRTRKDGRAIPGFLDDYAYFISALLEWYQVTFDEKAIRQADELAQHLLTHFSDAKSGMFFFTPKENTELAARKIDTSDNVTPSPNSVMAYNLFLLGKLLDKKEYSERAEKMLGAVVPQMLEYGPFYSNWARLLSAMAGPFYEVAIAGEDALKMRVDLEQGYHPLKLVCGDVKGESSLPLLEQKYTRGMTLAYVCVDRVCGLPATTAGEALKQFRA